MRLRTNQRGVVEGKELTNVDEGVDTRMMLVPSGSKKLATTMSKTVLIVAIRIRLVLIRQNCNTLEANLLSLGPELRFAKFRSGTAVCDGSATPPSLAARTA